MSFEGQIIEIFKKYNNNKNFNEVVFENLLQKVRFECEKSKLTSLFVLPSEIEKMFATLEAVQKIHPSYLLCELDILFACVAHMISCVKATKIRINPVLVKTWCDAGAAPKKKEDETTSYFEVRGVLFRDWEITRKSPRPVPFGDAAILRSSMPWPQTMKQKDVPFICLKLKDELRIISNDVLKLPNEKTVI